MFWLAGEVASPIFPAVGICVCVSARSDSRNLECRLALTKSRRVGPVERATPFVARDNDGLAGSPLTEVPEFNTDRAFVGAEQVPCSQGAQFNFWTKNETQSWRECENRLNLLTAPNVT